MAYIPKVGDVVDINPAAEALDWEYRPSPGVIKNETVVEVHDHTHNPGHIVVVLENGRGISICRNTGAYWNAARHMSNPPSLFLFSAGEKSSSNKNLKSLNTDGRTVCAACGCQLKDPGMGLMYRYCPKCEP